MTSLRILHIIGLVVFLMQGAFFTSCKPEKQPVDWEKYYNTSKKTPYGLYIFKEELQNLKNGFNAVELVKQENMLDYFNERDYTFVDEFDYILNQSALYINYECKLNSASITALLNSYIYFGNHALLIAHKLPEELYAAENIRVKETTSSFENVHFSLENSNNIYKLDQIEYLEYFEFENSERVMPLGYLTTSSGDQLCNFLAFQYGEGIVFLHTTPELFTNYALLKENNSNYMAQVLSNLNNTELIYFADYTEVAEYNTLSYIMQQPGLKAAWYLLWLILLLFVFTQLKRMQRIIPVINEKENYTVMYAKRIAQFNLLQKNYNGLIETQILLVLDKLRSEHRMDTSLINDDFAEKMHNATNCNIYTAREFVNYLKKQKNRTIAFSFDFDELIKIINKLNLK